MILVTGTIDVDPARRDDVIDALRPLAKETREEAGCLWYSFATDVDDAGRLHVHEQWESEEALAAHMQSPHFGRFMAAVPSLGVRAADVRRHDVTASRSVFG